MSIQSDYNKVNEEKLNNLELTEPSNEFFGVKEFPESLGDKASPAPK